LEICKALLLDNPSKGLLGNHDVEKLLQACDNEKNTPLHLAARANNEEIFKCLLESGRNLNNSNSNGEKNNLKNSNSNEGKKNDMYGITEPLNRNERTPLLECAKYNRKSFIEELLPTKDNSRKWKKTLDQLRDEDRMTCLHLACNQGKHETYS
jgi:ankyrin repeat protein